MFFSERDSNLDYHILEETDGDTGAMTFSLVVSSLVILGLPIALGYGLIWLIAKL